MINHTTYIYNAQSDDEREVLDFQDLSINHPVSECPDCSERKQLYRCLYCGIYRCDECSGIHFGQSYNDYVAERKQGKDHHTQVFNEKLFPILSFFGYSHLPPHLQKVSKKFHDMARTLIHLPNKSEADHALRKLLESKDAAVRAAIPRD